MHHASRQGYRQLDFPTNTPKIKKGKERQTDGTTRECRLDLKIQRPRRTDCMYQVSPILYKVPPAIVSTNAAHFNIANANVYHDVRVPELSKDDSREIWYTGISPCY
jgi:hypothetical protein